MIIEDNEIVITWLVINIRKFYLKQLLSQLCVEYYKKPDGRLIRVTFDTIVTFDLAAFDLQDHLLEVLSSFQVSVLP